MTARLIEERLRLFLLCLAALMCVGTAIELWFAEHTKELIQLLPFVLCGVGLAAIVAALLCPRRGTIQALRLVMSLLAAGGLLGLYEHVRSNLEVVLEVKPGPVTAAALWEAMHGAAPLLAPGALAVMAAIAVAATYYHPALGNRERII